MLNIPLITDNFPDPARKPMESAASQISDRIRHFLHHRRSKSLKTGRMRKYPRFGRQFAKACTQFPMFSESDALLVPVDADFAHLSLILWMHKQAEKTKTTKSLKLVHFFSTEEPAPETLGALEKVCASRALTFSVKRVAEPQTLLDLKQIYIDAAIENGCNKVALPDSLDYIDAFILSRMACDAVFTGPSVCESLTVGDKALVFIRPFCFLTDDEIAKFAKMSEFENKPTGVMVREEEFMSVARSALQYLLDDSSNIRMNFFNSQFNIQKKFIGSGGDSNEVRDDE